MSTSETRSEEEILKRYAYAFQFVGVKKIKRLKPCIDSVCKEIDVLIRTNEGGGESIDGRGSEHFVCSDTIKSTAIKAVVSWYALSAIL